jgi:hypothetical protein
MRPGPLVRSARLPPIQPLRHPQRSRPACAPISLSLRACDDGAAWGLRRPPRVGRFRQPSPAPPGQEPQRSLSPLPPSSDHREIVCGAGSILPDGWSARHHRRAPFSPPVRGSAPSPPLHGGEPWPPGRQWRRPSLYCPWFHPTLPGRQAAALIAASVSAWGRASQSNRPDRLRRGPAPRADQARGLLPRSCARSTHVPSFLRTARRREFRPLGRPGWRRPGNCTSQCSGEPSAYSPMIRLPNSTRVNTHGNTSSWSRGPCSRRSGPDSSGGRTGGRLPDTRPRPP